VNRWGLIKLNPSNRKFTWSNNQVNHVIAKLDSIFVSTQWEKVSPLVRISALPKGISDHNPLLVDIGDNLSFGKKIFIFEKRWLERTDFRDVVLKAAWNTPIEVSQNKVRNLRRMVRG
jgi:hypothetical protein